MVAETDQSLALDRERHLQIRPSIAHRPEATDRIDAQTRSDPARDAERPAGQVHPRENVVVELEFGDLESFSHRASTHNGSIRPAVDGTAALHLALRGKHQLRPPPRLA